MQINGNTKVYALIGDPVEHTLSPAIHNAAFKQLNINAIYVALQVASPVLTEAVKGLRNLGIQGFNVTIPYKTSVLRLLDEVEPLAKNIGAVNTVKNDRGKLLGYNTDGEGALKALESEGVEVRGKKVVLVGAGGAARAIGFTLSKLVDKLVILNRTEEKAVSLSLEISRYSGKQVRGSGLKPQILSDELRDTEIIINATSVGMYPDVDDTPIGKGFINSGMTVFDIVYKPLKTRLLRGAEEKGAKTLSGLSMLVYQAAKSFEIWTGIRPLEKVMFQAAMEELKKTHDLW